MRNDLKIRSFIAIELPVEIKNKFRIFTDSFKNEYLGKDIKWVNTNNIHLTLKFLGDTDQFTIQKIGDNFEQYPSKFPFPQIQVSTIGAFPNKNNPRVLWAGCSNPDELINIYTYLNQICTSLNFPKENRKFSPHFTLGRLRPNPSFETIQFIQSRIKLNNSIEFGSFIVRQIIIFQSELQPNGPIYTPIRVLNLSR